MMILIILILIFIAFLINPEATMGVIFSLIVLAAICAAIGGALFVAFVLFN